MAGKRTVFPSGGWMTNNEFLVRDGLTEEEALALVREYEGRGHRQAYWVKQESGAADSVAPAAS
jgi:hypothetical protein